MSNEATQQLAAMANAAGICGIVDEDAAPVVKIEPDLNMTAKKLGQIIARLDLYNLNGEQVYFDHEGKMQVMTGRKFRTWICDYVVTCQKFDNKSGDAIPVSLQVDEASTILESENFKRGVRPLLGINRERCPVIREGGKLEQLPWGYDLETGIYTVPGGLEYGTDMDIAAAKGHFHRLLHQFPITDERSLAVQVMAMLALFVRHLPNGSSLRPGIIWYANKPGSGKSVLAKIILYICFGQAAAAKLKKEEDLDKEIEAFCRARVPYIFLDNVRGGLNSTTIEQMLTSKQSTFRGMGGHSVVTTDNTALLLVSANQVEFNDDTRRRFALVDLFEEGNPEERVIDTELDDDLMATDEWRRGMLEALWAMVANWHGAGMPLSKVVMPSFEGFCRLLGGIVEAAGYHAPFERWVLPDAKAPGREDFHDLLALVLAEMDGDVERNFSLQDLCRIARSGQLYQRDVGTEDEGRKLTIKEDGISKEHRAMATDLGYMTQSHQSAFGKRITKEIGTKPVINGRQIEFGKRAQSRKATYTVKVL